MGIFILQTYRLLPELLLWHWCLGHCTQCDPAGCALPHLSPADYLPVQNH